MSRSLKESLIISASTLMLLVVGTGKINTNASRRDSSNSVSRYSTVWAGRPMSKSQQIRMEHRYFYVSSQDVNDPNWYMKNCHKVLRYAGKEPATLSQMASHFYTNRSRSFIKGYNDNYGNSHGGYFYVRPHLIHHHINPNSYKEGWVMYMASPGYGDHYTLKDFKSALNEYQLVAYGPTRRQRSRWTKFEMSNLKPSIKQSNRPSWYFRRYKKDFNYWSNHDRYGSSVNRMLFMTRFGRSFDRGFNDEYTIFTPHKHNNLRYLKRHHLDPISYKCGWIIGKCAQSTSGNLDKVSKRDFSKWIHDYNY